MNQEISVVCADRITVVTTEYAPEIEPVAQILVGGATGVPQGFYRRFAEHANQQGFLVRTLDYRGVGKSAPSSLRGYRMNYLDWARQDLVATLNHMTQKNPLLNTYFVGHSYGGHALGLMSNHTIIKKAVAFATGAGWSGHMPFSERAKVNFLWNFIGPIITPIVGYMPGKIIGGADLPLDVYKQWRRWCQYPHYFFDDPQMRHLLTGFSEVVTPIRAVNASDDLWALPVSRDHFFKGYTRASVTKIDIEPNQLALKNGIGHMGYFRKECEPLWNPCLEWFLSDKP
jgi:predicted alpha/beta hydrolase